MKLRMNKEKTKIKTPRTSKILGFSFWKRQSKWTIRIAPSSVEKLKTKLREHTGRSQGISMGRRIIFINQLLQGWINYFGIGKSKRAIEGIEEFLRTRLRVIRWKEWKRISTKIRELVKLGVSKGLAYQHANTRKSYTRIAHSPILLKTLNNNYFKELGLFQLMERYMSKHPSY